jgi:hypothetical protein
MLEVTMFCDCWILSARETVFASVDAPKAFETGGAEFCLSPV